MAYTLVTTPSARKSLKKLPKSVRVALIDKLAPLQSNSNEGKQLHGKLKAIRVIRLVLVGVDYRVAYEVNSDTNQVVIHYAATRENFYKELIRLKLTAKQS